MNIVTEKLCRECNKVKKVSEYAADTRRTDKLKSYCIICDAKRYRNWVSKTRDKRTKYRSSYYQDHKEHENRNAKIWDKNNPDKISQKNRNRRARLKNSIGRISLEEWNSLKKKYNNKCLSCKKKEPSIVLTLDHIIPISMGGENNIKNAQPLCISCNSKKRTKVIDYR